MTLPDTQERYPNKEMREAFNIFLGPAGKANLTELMKGFMWDAWEAAWQAATLRQREQDALICEAQRAAVAPGGKTGQSILEQSCGLCASAIRTPPQPGAAQ